jgi:hypothetical protein
MSKWSHADVLDGGLNVIKNNVTRICVCNAQPASYADAITNYKLAIKTISSSDFTGPSAGSSSSRVLQSNQHTNVTIDTTGDATHVAWCDSVNSKLLHVTTTVSQTITQGGTVTIPACNISYPQPV